MPETKTSNNKINDVTYFPIPQISNLKGDSFGDKESSTRALASIADT